MLNKLGTAKRAKIFGLLLEAMSMRAICRVKDVSWRRVDKLLQDATRVAATRDVRGFPLST